MATHNATMDCRRSIMIFYGANIYVFKFSRIMANEIIMDIHLFALGFPQH